MFTVQLSAASGVPFYRQLEDALAVAIRSGALAPGSRLPSVREAAEQWLVSAITVRAAYDALERAGLIVRRQGNGTFVADHVGTSQLAQVQAEALERVVAAVQSARAVGVSEEQLLTALSDGASVERS